MTELSPRVLEMLQAANWSASYRWSAAPALEDELRKRGHRLNAAAHDFLSSYGGLHCRRRNPYRPEAGTLLGHTDARLAAECVERSEIAPWEEKIGAQLCPIGEWGYGDFVMLMDEHGRVFVLDQMGRLTKWAVSGDDLLEGLFALGGTQEPVDETSHRWPEA